MLSNKDFMKKNIKKYLYICVITALMLCMIVGYSRYESSSFIYRYHNNYPFREKHFPKYMLHQVYQESARLDMELQKWQYLNNCCFHTFDIMVNDGVDDF